MSQQTGGLINEGGASVAEDPAALLPCLKERTWVGREHAVSRVLWPNEASAYMPWVGVGYDRPHTFQFLTMQDLARMQTTEAALEARALANLRRRTATWEKVKVAPEKGSRFAMLACMDDFLAAERILDPEFMQQAQRTLRARGLLVGIPRRERLFCIDIELDPEAIPTFSIMVAQEFASGQSAPISPMLFMMKDGAIVGITEAVADAIMPHLEAERAELEQNEETAPYVATMIVQNDQGTEDVNLIVGGLDAARLADGLQCGFMQVLKEQIPRKEFSGHIKVVVLGHTPDEAKLHIPEVMTHLQGYCAEVSKQLGTPLRVSLEHQKSGWPTKPSGQSTSVRSTSTLESPPPVDDAEPSLLSRVAMWIIGGFLLYAMKELILALLG